MKTHYLATLTGLCLLLWSGAAMASETRVTSMGGTGLFTYDNSNLRLFPGSLYRYPDLILTELRFKNQENSFLAGVHLPLGDRGMAALYLNRDFNLPVPPQISTTLGALRGADFTFGTQFGENALGIRVAVAAEDRERTTVDTLVAALDESARYFELAGGVSSELYDFGAYFGLPEVRSSVGGTEQKWTGTGFGVSGRFFLGPADGIQYVPAVVLNQFSADLETEDQSIDTEFLEFRMNFGFRYPVNPQNLVILGVELFGIRQNESDTPGVGKTTQKIINRPAFYLGGETQAKKWLFLRLGAIQAFQEIQTTFRPVGQPKREDTLQDSQFNVFVGLGVQLGRFLLDLDINDNFLFEGPDFISGQGANAVDDFVHRVSITYTF